MLEKLRLEIADINLLAAKFVQGDRWCYRSGYQSSPWKIIIGHLAPYVIKQAETVIVLRKNPWLEKIYSQRNYSKEKTLENIH